MENEQIDFQDSIFKKAIKKSKNNDLVISLMSLLLYQKEQKNKH